jgi:hypothetical protein
MVHIIPGVILISTLIADLDKDEHVLGMIERGELNRFQTPLTGYPYAILYDPRLVETALDDSRALVRDKESSLEAASSRPDDERRVMANGERWDLFYWSQLVFCRALVEHLERELGLE